MYYVYLIGTVILICYATYSHTIKINKKLESLFQIYQLLFYYFLELISNKHPIS